MFEKWKDKQVSSIKKELVEQKEKYTSLLRDHEALKMENTHLHMQICERDTEIERLHNERRDNMQSIRQWQESYRMCMSQCEELKADYARKMDSALKLINQFYQKGDT